MRRGDKNAFDQIYWRYWHKLFMYSGKVVKDEEEAQDIVQDIFISLWQRRKSLGEIKCLSSYLHGAVRFKGFAYIRANLFKNNYLSSLRSHLEDGNDSINEQINFKELNTILHGEIGKLPPKMREIFILSRVEQLTYKEIADRLNISDKTVKKQINRSLSIFRRTLEQNPGSLLTFILTQIYIR